MAATPPVQRPTWTRRIPGWSFAAFFVSLIILTYLAVYFYNRGDLVSTGYLAGLASVVPVLLVIAIYVVVPVWAIPVDLAVDDIAQALSRATLGLPVEAVAERKGVFTRCVSVVRFASPACTVGWYVLPASERLTAPGLRSTVILRPETRDRKALAAFRETLARALLEPPSPAQTVT